MNRQIRQLVAPVGVQSRVNRSPRAGLDSPRSQRSALVREGDGLRPREPGTEAGSASPPGKSRFCTTISRDPPKGIGSNLGSIGAYLVGTPYRNEVAIAIAKFLICAETRKPWPAARRHWGHRDFARQYLAIRPRESAQTWAAWAHTYYVLPVETMSRSPLPKF